MDNTNFCYWLKGFFEISRADTLTPGQVQEIRNHLNLALNKPIDNSFDLEPNPYYFNLNTNNPYGITGMGWYPGSC